MNDVSIIQWGDLPETALLDETGFAVKSLTRTPSRTKKTYKNAQGATFALRFIDPIITFSFTGMSDGTATSLGGVHPGKGVTSLLNFAEAVHEFDPGVGVLIYEEPEDTFNGEDPAETKFDVVQYPFVASGPPLEI